MSRLKFALACVCLLAAAGVALLAQDVRAWAKAVSAGDRAYVRRPVQASWRPETEVGGAAAKLLGVNHDVQLRESLQRYVKASRLHLRLDNAVAVEEARVEAEDALGRVARSADERTASQALTLLGILAYQGSPSAGAEEPIAAASSDFADAVRAAPGNADAAYDLELVLRVARARGSRTQPGPDTGAGASGRRGGSGGQPGSGY